MSFLLAFVLPIFGISNATAQEIRYVYDELNRLVGVIDQQGNAAQYVYDAVGNILQVKRFNLDPSAAVAIGLVTPGRGKAGTEVRIYGKGFSPMPAENHVAFNGTPAAVSVATATTIVTSVPNGATSGPISVASRLGTASSPEPFAVLATLAVLPDEATVFVGKTYRFQATLDGAPLADVTWQVEEVVGGNAQLGTIAADGLYTAPASLPPVNPLRVQAMRPGSSGETAAAQVTLLPTSAGGVTGARLSVGPVQGAAGAAPLATCALSVGSAPPDLTASPLAPPVLSVGPAPPWVTAAPLAVLTVSSGPVVTAVSPATGSRGTSVLVTLAGVGLEGATALTVLNGTAADPSVTVSGLAVEPGGTQATATLTITGSAAVGGRILRITVGDHTSTALGTGGNAFNVQ